MDKNITISRPNNREFEEVKELVKDFWLDDSNMQQEQFKVLLYNRKLVAFGRIRKNKDATELCTLGVLKEFRGKYLGTTMVKALLTGIYKDVYVVSVIPIFFSKLGFKEVAAYPESIKGKIDLCNTHYKVESSYKVMKYAADNFSKA